MRKQLPKPGLEMFQNAFVISGLHEGDVSYCSVL